MTGVRKPRGISTSLFSSIKHPTIHALSCHGLYPQSLPALTPVSLEENLLQVTSPCYDRSKDREPCVSGRRETTALSSAVVNHCVSEHSSPNCVPDTKQYWSNRIPGPETKRSLNRTNFKETVTRVLPSEQTFFRWQRNPLPAATSSPPTDPHAEVGKQRKSARAKSTRVCPESAVAAHKARLEQAQSVRVRPKLTDS
jgi:hypothetical protein